MEVRVDAVINLTEGELEITKSVTIDGDVRITIDDGDGADNTFDTGIRFLYATDANQTLCKNILTAENPARPLAATKVF